MRLPKLLLATMALSALSTAATSREGFKVIVHPSNPVTSLPREQVARFFLKKTTTWPSGKSVTAIDQVKESGVREAFSRDTLMKTVAEVSAYWQQQIFSGRGVPPVEKSGDAAVVAFVEGNEGAIGYVAPGASVGDARVVNVSQ